MGCRDRDFPPGYPVPTNTDKGAKTYRHRLCPLGRHARVGREQGGAEFLLLPTLSGAGALAPHAVQAAGKKYRAVNEMSLERETFWGPSAPFFLFPKSIRIFWQHFAGF